MSVLLLSCSDSSDLHLPTDFRPLSETLSSDLGEPTLDYSNPSLWGCSGENQSDVCDTEYFMVTLHSNGTSETSKTGPDPMVPLDCFYIYPTVDWNLEPGNHDDLNSVRLSEMTIQTQAGRFSEVCRVFAPYYRQSTIGGYAMANATGVRIFKKAFMDVATAFEFYLRTWNEGRPLVIMGHSQGAQMASYLLHTYFDGSKFVTDIPGSHRSDLLKKRLVVALPIGFNVFTPIGKELGGSFSDIPLCTSTTQTGCVIHYRSFPDGFEFDPRAIGESVDSLVGKAGFLFKPYDALTDEISCVNPSNVPLPDGHSSTDSEGNPVAPGDIRVLQGTFLVGLFYSGTVKPGTRQPASLRPALYTATCRNHPDGDNYLAIGFHQTPAEKDMRGDPIGVASATSGMGLHLYDFNLAMGDLIEQVRVRYEEYRTAK